MAVIPSPIQTQQSCEKDHVLVSKSFFIVFLWFSAIGLQPCRRTAFLLFLSSLSVLYCWHLRAFCQFQVETKHSGICSCPFRSEHSQLLSFFFLAVCFNQSGSSFLMCCKAFMAVCHLFMWLVWQKPNLSFFSY